MNELTIARFGRAWAIFDGDRRISEPSHDDSKLAIKIRRMERERRQTPRRCLCCTHWFRSEGAHNRLCTQCRNRPSDMG
jgi:hypothetical protein